MNTILKSLKEAVKYWYLPLIVGVLFVVLGIYVFFVPAETYLTLSVLFSISFLISGLLDIYFSILNSKILSGWGWYLVGGLFSTAMGVYLLVNPAISLVILPYVVGFTLLFRSFLFLGFSFELKGLNILSWGNVALTSILGIIFSFLLLISPVATGFSLVVITACVFIFAGISSIALSFNLKKMKDYPNKISSELKAKFESINKQMEEEYENS
ncbi:MAG: hypothetical protein H6Q18_142 [Bacteroidetes bacterium]|nr:hypothetical protein [Bacteroidota bacterium]